MIAALLLIPLIGGLLAFLLRSDAGSRALLLGGALAHAVLTLLCWIYPAAPLWNGWLQLDALGLLFLSITSLIFLAASFYVLGYLRGEAKGRQVETESGSFFVNAPEAVFTGCLLFFLGTMTAVTVSHHLGLLWVAVEATTLATAPLIYFHRRPRSLEATWKYLLVCSVGIALALLGNFLMAAAAEGSQGSSSLLVETLVAAGPRLQTAWLKASFIFLLVGYGTKMGLVPLHTWLPDAHSEAPSAVSALLSGTLLNCAFLALLRALQVCTAAGLATFCQSLLVGFGLLSMAVAAGFIVGQTDFKRLLAYSSVEHMGILALGAGLGGAATVGALLHAVNHSLTKAALFFTAGSILGACKTKSVTHIKGLLRFMPITGALWIGGLLAITGTPPFGTFISEFTILKAAVDQDHLMIVMAVLGILAVVFISMASTFLRMAQGPIPASLPANAREHKSMVLPAVALGVLVLVLGVHIPPFLQTVLNAAAATIGGP